MLGGDGKDTKDEVNGMKATGLPLSEITNAALALAAVITRPLKPETGIQDIF